MRQRRSALFSGLFLLVSSFVCSAQQVDISLNQYKNAMLQKDVQVLDVRTIEEYNTGHLKNAFLADFTKPQQFAERINSLDKAKPVYIYCLSGGRSRAAANMLIKQGFKEVYNMSGGLIAWKVAQLPLEGKVTSPIMSMDEYLALIPKNKTVLVDVGAKWCPPCKKMEPLISDIVNNNQGLFELVQIDAGAQENLAAQLGAGALPTFIIYKNGKETWRQSGIVSKEKLLEQLQ